MKMTATWFWNGYTDGMCGIANIAGLTWEDEGETVQRRVQRFRRAVPSRR